MANSPLGQFSSNDQPHSCLNISAGDGGSIVIASQFRCFNGNSVKDIIGKAVHDAHGLAGQTEIWVDLLQHLVDVISIALFPLSLPLLVPRPGCLAANI